MPERETIERAREDKREGKSPSTQAGEFVRQEIEHVREGKHGARSTKQAIAIGLSEARRAGMKLPAKKGTSARTQKQAKRDLAKGKQGAKKVSAKRSRAVSAALKREGRGAASNRRSRSRRARAPNVVRRRSDPAPRKRPRGPRARQGAHRPRARRHARAPESNEA